MYRPVFVRFPVTVGLSCFGFKKRVRTDVEHDVGSWYRTRVARDMRSVVFVVWSQCACRVEQHEIALPPQNTTHFLCPGFPNICTTLVLNEFLFTCQLALHEF